MLKEIYLDNASTTPVFDKVKAWSINMINNYGNPSSAHMYGRMAKNILQTTREEIAKTINANTDEIYFTSGGSEGNNLCLHDKTVLTSLIEHSSVLNITSLHKLNNNISGVVIKEITGNNPEINTMSCMMVNNELGTIQPIKKLCKLARDNGMLFHTDAVQAVGHVPIDVKEMGVDMLTGSAHKFGGLKGAGFAYIKKGTPIIPLIIGGHQENTLRAGTENVLGIGAMGIAIQEVKLYRNTNIKDMRDKLLEVLLNINGVELNGSLKDRVDSNINISIKGIDGEQMVAMCDSEGIFISTGSACNEGLKTPSHVLKAIGLSDDVANSSVRITLGEQNTMDEINYCCDMLPKIIKALR